MAQLTHNGLSNNFSSGTTDGLYMMSVTIQNASTTGAIIDHDSWNSITFHSIQAVTSGSNKGPNVITGLPSHHWRADLYSNGTTNSLGFSSNNGSGSTKLVYMHYTGGE